MARYSSRCRSDRLLTSRMASRVPSIGKKRLARQIDQLRRRAQVTVSDPLAGLEARLEMVQRRRLRREKNRRGAPLRQPAIFKQLRRMLRHRKLLFLGGRRRQRREHGRHQPGSKRNSRGVAHGGKAGVKRRSVNAQARVAEVHLRATRTGHAMPSLGQREEERRPAPGAASAQMRPPWRSTMRRTVARPTPVPSNSCA